MKAYKYPRNEQWQDLAKRPTIEGAFLSQAVKEILAKVVEEKDQALRYYSEKFDGVSLERIQVDAIEISNAIDLVADDLKRAIRVASNNIEKFHKSQKEEEQVIETSPGVRCWRKSVGIEKVGLYIPGGTAPLFSTILMLGVPAKIAGCREVILCTPPDKNGQINPVVLYTANLVGINRIYKVGGAQAIAAMAYGTETVPQVYKIFGPGNQFVTKAKELIQQEGVAIDMPAGPSEVLVIADDTARPEFVAADLLSQAEHGTDSQVVLLSINQQLIDETISQLQVQLAQLPRKEIAQEALKNSRSVLLRSMEECFEFSNQYAPEHLIIASESAENFIDKITSAGSVFLGNYSCESAGDYATGTNHTLPTNGYARNYSGVSLDSFIKKITFQKLNPVGIRNIGSAIELMAEAEGLFAHKNAVTVRLKDCQLSTDNNENQESTIIDMVRPNIQQLKPYSSARDEFDGTKGAFLDANENPYGVLNRYPDPYQKTLKSRLSELKNVSTNQIFVGNGSDEVIDLAFRIFCNPGTDKALTLSPTYGMYEVSAAINDIDLIKIPLKEDFQIDVPQLTYYLKDSTFKLIFICSPNNPTGNSFNRRDIEYVIENFRGIVIIDEAYIDFSPNESYISLLDKYSNLIITQTFSKAWGLAAARVGTAYADENIIKLFNKVKPPYNISELNQKAVIKALSEIKQFEINRISILKEKSSLEMALDEFAIVQKVYPSDTNFLLVEFKNAEITYENLVKQKVITRNRHKLVKNCIRISIGTPLENKELLTALENLNYE